MPKILLTMIVVTSLLFSSTSSALASHSWGNYHWARSANPFTLRLGDNLTSTWDPHLLLASTDWSVSSVLDTTIVPGLGGKNCGATSGRIEICNKKYGRNGWLGIAQIYLSGDHITKGITKLNDTYFNTNTYNTPAWRQLVMCQEVGHNFGLDHQDEDFSNANLNTCMDYTNNPLTNQSPNAHDYDEIESIYNHLDTVTTVAQALTQVSRAHSDDPGEDRTNWGKLVRQNGRAAIYEKDLGHDQKMITHVFYAETH